MLILLKLKFLSYLCTTPILERLKNIQSMKENCFELLKSVCDSFNALDFENPREKRFTYHENGREFYIQGLQADLSMLLVLFQHSLHKGFVFRLDSHYDDYALRLVCRAL